jgi:hypothetical protein
MSQKYSSDSVVFAIISSEKKNRVNDFLLKRPVKAIWLIDSISNKSKENTKINDLSGITAQRFGVEGIPYTVIIDKNGILCWIGHAGQLTPSIMESVLRGETQKIQEDAKRRDSIAISRELLRKKVFESLKMDTIFDQKYKVIAGRVPYHTPNMSAGSGRKTGKQYVEFGGSTIEFLYQYFTRKSSLRINNSLPISDSGYFIRLEMDASYTNQDFQKYGLQALLRSFPVTFDQKGVPKTVWSIRIENKKLYQKNTKPLEASTHRSSDESDKEMIYNNYSLSQIIPDLEDELGIFIEAVPNALNKGFGDFRIPRGDLDYMKLKLFEIYGIRLEKMKGIKVAIITEIKSK